MITHEQLRVLDAVVGEGTFRAAAEKLHKTQPAVSHMIKQLETAAGVTLLSRDGYRPVLTPEGRAFHRQACIVLSQMRELRNLADRLAARQEPEVALSVSATCPMAPVLAVVGAVGRAYPQTHIKLATDVLGGAADRLMRGEADIIVAPDNSAPLDEVESIPFLELDIIPVARPGYGPERDAGPIENAAMRAFVQVVVAGTGRGAYDQTRDVLPDGLRWTVTDFAAKKEILLAGMGWGGMPEHMIRAELESGTLVRLDLAGYPVRHSRLMIMRRRDRRGGLVGQALWQALAGEDRMPEKT
ncbi:MAG: LysR family transcriptional regulator [Alphaproteobacteria bacterium]|nr:LysR family transcriptional regulator [Pseudomonadota bacterium]